MERNYRTILIIINLIFVFSIIIIPSFVIFTEFSSFNRIDQSFSYIYSSTTPPIKKGLNLNADVGIIEIKYISQPVDYLVRIDVSIEMAGPNLEGKSYLDIFNIKWENTTSPVNFTLELIPEMLEDFSNLHKANIYINILLRSDILFDINATVIDGNILVAIPMGITVNNVYSSVTSGYISYDFIHSTIKGNITGIVNNGNLTLIAYNNHYIKNSKLTFINKMGYTQIDIYQYEEMGANITGTVSTKSGIIQVIYNDYSANVGARFILYNKTTFGNEVENKWVGFNREVLPLLAGQMFTSYDFPTQNNYNFSLFKPEDEGNFIWDLNSIPS
ncbi:MAG: hypothetical protein JSV62_10065 [Promethearchaeota archaeon]|nr:MAG: hypothetical protein JSV62_10065 [Candidatus Lokiarchaeota archaeon]